MKAEKGKKQNIKTSNFDKMSSLIKDVTNQNLKSIVIPLELIEYAGEIQKAAFLARLIYLSDKGSKPNGFIWKSYPEWKKEIGLSQYQVERIVADFQGRNILEAKKMMAASKNSNASHTWHYKLLMNNFSTDFKKFLLVRAEENLGLEAEETSSSITDSTNINTFENTSLYKEPYKEIEEKDVIEKTDLDIDSDSPDNGDYSDDLDFVPEEYPSAAPDAAFLSADFEPLLEHQIWAVNSYPYKSPKFITDKFKSYFTTGKGKDVKKSDAEWQLSWRGWITMEKSFGATQDSFEEEHRKIKNKLLFLVCKYVWNHRFPVVLHSNIIEEFCKNGNFDESSINEQLNSNKEVGNINSYFDCYYNLPEFETNPERAENVDYCMYRYAKSNRSTPLEIFKLIHSKIVVTESDLKKEFHYSFHNSIEHFLRVCLKFNTLTQIGEYYHQSFESIENNGTYEDAETNERIQKIEHKLEELNLNNS